MGRGNRKGEQRILEVSDKFKIGLLNPQTKEWEDIGEIKLNERRRGFWHGMLPQKDLSAYLKIGVFNATGESHFQYPDDPLEFLRGKNLPILWQWLWRTKDK